MYLYPLGASRILLSIVINWKNKQYKYINGTNIILYIKCKVNKLLNRNNVNVYLVFVYNLNWY